MVTLFRLSDARSSLLCRATAQLSLMRRAGALSVLALVLWAACASIQGSHERSLDAWSARQASTAAADAALLSAARDADPLSAPLADQLLKGGTEPQTASIELGIESSASIDPLGTLHLQSDPAGLAIRAGTDWPHARPTLLAPDFFSLPLRPPRLA